MNSQSSMQNILIYRLGSLGDTIMALPCFNEIRNRYPSSDITLLTNKPIHSKAAPVEAVLGNNYFFNRVLSYPVGTRNPFLLYSLIKQIRSLDIHTVINLSSPRSLASLKRDKFFFQVAGVKHTIGFLTSPEDLVASIDRNTGEFEWEAKRLARRVESLDIISIDNDWCWDLHLTDIEEEEANQLLSVIGQGTPVIAVSAGTKMQSKDWGEKNWLDLMRLLRTKLENWALVMIGADEEAAFADECLAVWGGAGINLCGRISPRVSAAVLQYAQVFVGHDSGPMHLAACVGTPCVAIFSARNLPRQWYPRGENNRVLYHRTDCAGCGLETCIEQHKKCILSITVDEVEQAVLEIVA